VLLVQLAAPGCDGGAGDCGLPPLRYRPGGLAGLQPKYRGAVLEHEDPLRHGAAGQHAPDGHLNAAGSAAGTTGTGRPGGAPLYNMLPLGGCELRVGRGRGRFHATQFPPAKLFQEERGGVLGPAGAVKEAGVPAYEAVGSQAALAGGQRECHPLLGLFKPPADGLQIGVGIPHSSKLVEQVGHRFVDITEHGGRGLEAQGELEGIPALVGHSLQGQRRLQTFTSTG